MRKRPYEEFLPTNNSIGGVGHKLLQKMGWEPGKGLGKTESGSTNPLTVEMKLDRKGLTSSEVKQQRGGTDPMPSGFARGKIRCLFKKWNNLIIVFRDSDSMGTLFWPYLLEGSNQFRKAICHLKALNVL